MGLEEFTKEEIIAGVRTLEHLNDESEKRICYAIMTCKINKALKCWEEADENEQSLRKQLCELLKQPRTSGFEKELELMSKVDNAEAKTNECWKAYEKLQEKLQKEFW